MHPTILASTLLHRTSSCYPHRREIAGGWVTAEQPLKVKTENMCYCNIHPPAARAMPRDVRNVQDLHCYVTLFHDAVFTVTLSSKRAQGHDR